MSKHREIYLHSIRMSGQCIRTSVQCIQAKTTWLPTLKYLIFLCNIRTENKTTIVLQQPSPIFWDKGSIHEHINGSWGLYFARHEVFLSLKNPVTNKIKLLVLCLLRELIQGSYRQVWIKIHGIFKDFSKTFLLFSRTENLIKILIYTSKFYFWNARVLV